ncbi:hypothetical protein QR680_014774 [Steinernema hermaphroditum]|uniref:Uncharacterized protein n=1 Tax=Steinernema hermaphroditum TaxID=289476 RepID=A0AA39IBI4_9BILA|nr:hypothetical protein QR680_014774 [Steinernema hermaphroditum]
MWLLSVLAVVLITGFGVTRAEKWGTDSSILKVKVFNVTKSNIEVPDDEFLSLTFVQIDMFYSDRRFTSSEIAQLCLDNGATQSAAHILASNDRFKEVIRDYDQITQQKLLTFYEEMIQAYFIDDEFHVSYVLLHYLHLRSGFGMSRKLIRTLYPKCEEFAQIPEVRRFYLQHRGENPRALATLKEFMELIKWLIFEEKFKT